MPLLRKLFPGAIELQLIPLLASDSELATFRYNIKDSAREMRVNNELAWTRVDPELAVALVAWQLKSDDLSNPKAVSNQLKERDLLVIRLGLGSQMLESGDPKLSLNLIEGAYRALVGGEDLQLARRAREYMAYALAATAAAEAQAGNVAEAERLLSRLKSDEFDGCRAAMPSSGGR